ncbi:NAD(P)-dependent oxidoreductase [Actinotalea sp.]|uniref:NAD(P)-dependent oxidoreductase n=1 Tax=Actinotalea sp. TaxID=1872145 RepID=UPI003565B888
MRPRIVCPSAEGDFTELFAAEPLRSRLAAIGEVGLAPDVPDEAELVRRVAGADVVLLATHLPDEALLAAAGRLRLVSFTGTGAASYVNLDLARELGVTVTNVTHYGDQAVAELTLALMLAAARDVPAGDRAVRAGQWAGWSGRELAGSRLAVLGFGGIGRVVARLGVALGMRVGAWDKVTDPQAMAAAGVEPLGWAQAFDADVVSVHLPLTDETRGMITTAELDLLRPGSILVNTARGEILEPGALAARLARGDVRAALDVFDPEPLRPDDPLLTVPGTVLTPHLGFRTPAALARMAEGAVGNVEAFLSGVPRNVVV